MELTDQVSVIIKLLYMNTMSKISELEKGVVKTTSQKKAYEALDGKKTTAEIAQAAGYSDLSTLNKMLRKWEKQGFVLSIGKGAAKRYMNISNLDV